MTATAYVVGRRCTFHAPEGEVGPSCCPKCGRDLVVVSACDWNTRMRAAEQASPGYGEMIAWSVGRCFPDLDTMQNAYRQAMEE